ncbi:MAG TPA: hypothetical protein VIR01_17415, partial [Pyrinomonadaceae bacterium]
SVSALSSKELTDVFSSLRAQGADLERTKNGYLIRFPDGTSTTFHLTNSDTRSTRNMRASVRRAGLSWPFDARKDSGMDPRKARTYDSIRKALAKLPEKFTMDQLVKASGKSIGPIHRYLHDHSYTHKRLEGTTYWWYVEPQPDPESAPTPPAPVIVAEVESYPEIERAQAIANTKAPDKPASREFIDTADSWIVPVPTELQAMAEAMGLRIEVRVWHE